METCIANYIKPVWVYLPSLESSASAADESDIWLDGPIDAGYQTIDLANVYSGYDIDKLTFAPWDKHPNPLGYKLIANAIYKQINEDPSLIFSNWSN